MIYINISGNSILLEGVLQYLIVITEFVVMLGLPVNLGHVYTSWEDRINNLAINSSSGTLLNLLYIQLFTKRVINIIAVLID